ncbi:penicillin-binding transpeptidase domain-containing protein [Flavobacterium chilense]|uniref:beta-lactamase n=1 Tax=Flavobacterium chilense TaxID=946677 RepID=A0A1M6XB39_9FLAO|nr:penicillin-binding transpeptidase domain-containing protein [Flavobacterium chilense]SHL03210.1 beta-lactamase class D [Flavobacterium chilense]
MKLKLVSFGFIAIGLFFSCSSGNKIAKDSIALTPDKVEIRSDFKKYFDNCNAEGSIAIYDNQNQKWILSDTVSVKKETLPASTFKIINLLIALETKTISNENEIVKWPGSTDTIKYDYRPDIYHDISVKEAFEVSAGWAFIELAKKIGKENYKKYLSLCHYGNLDLSQTDPDFWNFGAFGISPVNQVEFLKNLYEEKLPFSKRNIEIVKEVMISEQNQDYTIHSKTGWTRENEINTGWWVGYLKNKKGVYFFATRLLQNRKINQSDFGNCRKDITKTAFRDLDIIK